MNSKMQNMHSRIAYADYADIFNTNFADVGLRG
jgi:hypothetical protein